MAPLTDRIQQSFLRQLELLPDDTRRLLLIAAAEPVGDQPLLWRAASLVGLGVDAVVPAEDAGLIELDGRVGSATPWCAPRSTRRHRLTQRREVHRVMAEVTDPRD